MPTTFAQRITRAGAALAAAFLTVGLLPGLAVAGAQSPTFNLYISDPCVVVRNSNAAQTLRLVWRDAGGALKAQQTLPAGSSYRSYCSSNPAIVVAAGDRIKVKYGSAVHRLVVPNLTINLNRVTDRLRGAAPARANLRIECAGSDPFRHFEGCMWTKKVTAGSNGIWSVRVPFDFIGGAEMAVRWTGNGGDQVRAWGSAPFVTVSLGRSIFSGAAPVNRVANIALRNATTLQQLATGTAVGDPFDGAFKGQFVNSGGRAFNVAAGQRLSANLASDTAWTVPNIDGSASASTDEVIGRCHDTGASRRLVNVLLFRSGVERGWALTDTDENGFFSFNFLTAEGNFWTNVNVRTNDKVVVRCMQAEGDWVQRIIFAGA